MLNERPGLQIVCEMSDGLEALNRAAKLQPDLILLDIGLPSVNRIEAARRIRQLSQIQDTLRELSAGMRLPLAMKSRSQHRHRHGLWLDPDDGEPSCLNEKDAFVPT